MKICIASDHRGYALKNSLINDLKEKYIIDDLGPYNEESTDYPKYGFLLGEKVANKEYDFGIVICGTGIGISIACNKVKGIRCAKVNSIEDTILTRRDNNANVIALDGKMDPLNAKQIVETFLTTPFASLDRYVKRINMITDYEKGKYHEN